MTTINSKFEIRNSKFGGFTLLEVMVAVVLMAFVLVSLLGLKNQSMKDVVTAERITTATLLARKIMYETLAVTPLKHEEKEGEFEEEAFKGFTWKKAVAPTAITTITEVRVAVLWKEGEREERVELVSYE